MKRILCVVLTVLMLCTAFVMTGCEAKTLKFGMGVTANVGAPTNADGETNGAGQVNTTVVAVLLDDAGKIVKIDLDTAQIKTAWTADGQLVETTDLRTKYDKGVDYGMAAYGKKHDGSDGAALEWNEQADAFMATVTGKTLDEVKALMGADGYATGDLATAGCTINVVEFMTALEKAVSTAVESDATEKDTLKVAMVSSTGSSKAASEEAEGLTQVDTTIAAVVVDEEGKVVIAKTDCTQGKTPFDATGVSTAVAGEFKSKLELGYDYNMKAFGHKHDGSEGQPLEWFEQSAEFDAALVGKTAAEFAAFAGDDGYAVGDIATAGCTMNLAAMIEAAATAAK